MTDNEYIVLARKYRPKKFSDIIGQDEVCSVIEGAIKLNRVAHAFLFSGTRGIGKTTIARILAKTLNCENLDLKNPEPCGKCKNCISIDNDSNIDVVEIDAASRTGVADVREIIENINYKPVDAKKKIFIIDEVHMLSKAAFNALLKTLEEPPLDVVFIFATTETEKVPVTILSRCQRFVLRRVDLNMITDHLINIAKKEGYTLDKESAQIISICSEGSMRDSLSILDNVLARNKKISPELVRNVIGLTDNTQALDLFESLCNGEVKLSLEKFQELYEKGISIDELAKSLMKLTYNLALIKSKFENSYDLFDSKSIDRLKKLSEKFEMDFLTRFWEVMQRYLNELSDTFDEKQCFEMAIMRMCYISLIPTPFEALIKKEDNKKRLEEIEENQQSSQNNDSQITQKKTSEIVNNNLALKKDLLDQNKISKNSESNLKKFTKLVEFLEKKSEMLVAYHLRNSFRLVSYSELDGNKDAFHIELENIGENEEAQSILWKASKILGKLTNKRWILSVTNNSGFKSLSEIEQLNYERKVEQIKKEDSIKKILDIIPSSEVTSVKEIEKENIKNKEKK
jgi:DNA polymerase-3 subunit gamma/tau